MPFIAKYRGVCEDCGDDVLPGQEAAFVGHHVDGAIRHTQCPEDVGSKQATREVCPRCFIELPVTGVCEECE